MCGEYPFSQFVSYTCNQFNHLFDVIYGGKTLLAPVCLLLFDETPLQFTVAYVGMFEDFGRRHELYRAMQSY